MNKVINDITANKKSFSFKCDGKTYIVDLTTFGVWRAYASMGTIRREDQDRAYSLIFTSVSNKEIKDTLRSLSEFAQSNMKEACDEALQDLVFTALSVGKVTEILRDFETIEKDPIYGTLLKEKTKVKKAIGVGIKALPLLKAPVKIHDAIVGFDLDSVTDETLTKKADDFAEALDEFNDAIYELMKK